MQTTEIIRAWKDEDYRLSLTSANLGLIPHHPSGKIEMMVDKIDVAAVYTDLASTCHPTVVQFTPRECCCL